MIALGLFAGLAFTGNWQPLSTLGTTQGNLVERLFLVNVMLVVFNLLPAFPMDGGRVLRALLAMRMDYARATSIAATIGQGMAFLFGFIGLFTNPMLLFIAFFVWIGASQEAAAAERKASFSGAMVREAMLTDFKTLSPENTLGDASRLILSGSQHNFPVLDGERLAGMLVNTDLFAALREGSDSPVSQAMRRDFQTVEASEPLESALGKLSAERSLCLPVLQTGRLVGLLTAENVGEFFLIRRALAQSHRVPPRLNEAALRI
jgi:CBS domain-containing protein